MQTSQIPEDMGSTTEVEDVNLVELDSSIVELKEGQFAVRYDGDYGFDGFIDQGGSSSDGEVITYLADNLLSGLNLSDLLGSIWGTILSAFLTDPLVAMLMRMEGISNFSSWPDIFTVVLPGIIVTALFWLFAWFASGKIRKSPMTSLRGRRLIFQIHNIVKWGRNKYDLSDISN